MKKLYKSLLTLGGVAFLSTNMPAQATEVVDNNVVNGVNLDTAFVNNRGILNLGVDRNIVLTINDDIRLAPNCGCNGC